jgi:hypothetical protein
MISEEKIDKKRKNRRNKIATTDQLKDSRNIGTLFYNAIPFVSGKYTPIW